MKSIMLATVFACALTTTAFAWGDREHSIVAEIAQRHLTPKTTAAVQAILGSNESLASVASWADDYKLTEAGLTIKPWHYVDIDNAHDSYSPSDCPATGCLVSALQAQVKILADATKPTADRRQALFVLVHLVGNSTQPFHCSERNGDSGANGFFVDFAGNGPDGKRRPIHRARLHAIWDDTLIDDHVWNWGGYAGMLDMEVVPTITDVTYGDGFAEAWINECHAVARTLYGLTPVSNGAPVVIGPDYQATGQPILDRQLATGGLRLAAMLRVRPETL